MAYRKKAKEFLKISHDYKLGTLPTEKSNPKTIKLSEWSQKDIKKSLDVIKKIDLDLFKIAKSKFKKIEKLKEDIKNTLQTGGKIFLCGCGATGRLSLTLETIWRFSSSSKIDSVVSFMAGGDVALIHSIENFEDYPEYGEKQLLELGFGENDLLISTSEGGETPFVIGATIAAKEHSNRKPYFLYCNPDEELIKVAKRSEQIIQDDNIKKINLSVGEMVLAGSTRMQASTILMLVVGMGLFDKGLDWLDKFTSVFKHFDLDALEKFIIKESKIYENGDTIIYRSGKELAISVLTDTTERSPTFSLDSFESEDSRSHSLCYLSLKDSLSVESAWNSLLGRNPRTLEWEDSIELTGLKKILSFNISNKIINIRKKYILGTDHVFDISIKDNLLIFKLEDIEHSWNTKGLDLFAIHLLLKIMLNTHSTLVIGRMQRYQSNIMTWVRPSNNKLIDRTIRYVKILLENEGIDKSYDDICFELFKQMENASKGEALVLKVFKSIKKSL